MYLEFNELTNMSLLFKIYHNKFRITNQYWFFIVFSILQKEKRNFIKKIEKSDKNMSHINQTEKNALFYEFEEKMKNIDQIARLAIDEKQKKITEKYGNIQSTAKILKSFIIQFTKKSIKIEQELRTAARIDDLQYQTQYHTKRLQDCVELSSNLQNFIINKKNQIQKYEIESKRLKQNLILVKTQNIKKILKIEMLEKIEIRKALKESHQKRMQTFKQKINQNRMLTKTGLIYTPSTSDLLKKEKQELTTILWQKINKKLTISKYLFENYEYLKQKLVKQEKKSNKYGLNGSLFFKLQQNIKLSNLVGSSVGRKNKVDSKLLIYDVLKQKHSKEIKEENKEQSQIKIEFEQFMKFTPFQLLGLIELKGGISYLRKNGEFLSPNIQRKNDLNNTGNKKMVKNGEKSGQNYLTYNPHA